VIHEGQEPAVRRMCDPWGIPSVDWSGPGSVPCVTPVGNRDTGGPLTGSEVRALAGAAGRQT